MHTVEALQAALGLAEKAGYEVRYEWLGGGGGGACEVKGRKLLLLDVALGPREQLEIVLDALHRDELRTPTATDSPQSPPRLRKTA